MKQVINMDLKKKDLSKLSVRTFSALSAPTFFVIRSCVVEINIFFAVLVSPDISEICNVLVYDIKKNKLM